MDPTYITKAEIEVERTPGELATWAKAKFDEIAELPGGKDAVRFRKGLCKVLAEEVYGLSIWATQRFGDDSNIRLLPVVGSQSFDALVKNYSFDPPEIHHVEVTQAHPGESEHLRMLLLKENGWAWAHAKLQKTVRKKAGIKVSVYRHSTHILEFCQRPSG